MKKFIFLALLICTITYSQAQQELGTHFMRGYWQANRSNPALIPNHVFTIGLPNVYNNLVVDNVTLDDIIVQDEAGLNVVTFGEVIDNLEDDNIIRTNLDIETLSFGFTLDAFAITFSHSFHINGYLNYPKELMGVLFQGNSQYIGQEVPIGPDVHFFGYQEIAVGGSVKANEWLRVGARVKFLSGIADVSSDQNDLRLLTDEEIYELSIQGDYRLNSTGITSYEDFGDLEFDFDFNLDGLGENSTGAAFDLGAVMNFGDLEVAVSVLDLGGNLSWKDNPNNLTLSGPYSFDGLDIADELLEDSISIGSVVDTLESILDVVETNNTYSNEISTKYYLSGNYRLNNIWTVGALLYTESYRSENFTAVALSGQADLSKWITLGATYAYKNDAYDNLGLNMGLRLGPVQLIAATDNIISVFSPTTSNSSNFRVGLNLAFGSRVAIGPNEISDQEDFFGANE